MSRYGLRCLESFYDRLQDAVTSQTPSICGHFGLSAFDRQIPGWTRDGDVANQSTQSGVSGSNVRITCKAKAYENAPIPGSCRSRNASPLKDEHLLKRGFVSVFTFKVTKSGDTNVEKVRSALCSTMVRQALRER